jgi:hypothetical protein
MMVSARGFGWLERRHLLPPCTCHISFFRCQLSLKVGRKSIYIYQGFRSRHILILSEALSI